jgi:tetratricopeptide (TPR) repeat protein
LPLLPASDSLIGEVIVFTGKLSTLGRRDAHALVERLGATAADEVTARTTLLVIGAEGVGAPPLREQQNGDPLVKGDKGDRSQKVKKAKELNERGLAAIRMIGEDEFCRLVGLPSPEALKQQYYALRDVLGMYPRVREDQVRYLQKWGLIHPVLRTNTDVYLSFSDLLVIRQAAADLEQGVPFRAVLRSLKDSRDGQLTFNFRLDAERAKIIKLRARARSPELAPVPPDRFSPPTPTPAEACFLRASDLDDGDERKQGEAAAWYRRALEADPYLVAALINLANIHYTRDQLAEAQALYERAIGLEPDFFEAHFNLGNIYHDLGRYPEAATCYRDALALNPSYPDAHFYLAVTFEKMGHSHDAKPHWRAYQRLAPDGEWVALAREFSE